MPKRVLVIDDDVNTVDYLSIALKRNGYEAIGAYDGKEGFEKAGECRPDLLVLDIMIPKRTGWVVFRQLRKDEELRSIPVIMLTGVSMVLEEQDCLAEEEPEYQDLRDLLRRGIQEMREDGIERPEAFIDKPVDPEELVKKVRELIGD
jgi:CheY-like chemotaxis protein